MPADEYLRWQIHLERFGGDRKTQYLLALLIREIAGIFKKPPPEIHEFAPWLDSEHQRKAREHNKIVGIMNTVHQVYEASKNG